MEKIVTDCGNGGCQYAESHGGMRTNGGCRCDKCPKCSLDVRHFGHREWCDRKDWQRGMPRQSASIEPGWIDSVRIASTKATAQEIRESLEISAEDEAVARRVLSAGAQA